MNINTENKWYIFPDAKTVLYRKLGVPYTGIGNAELALASSAFGRYVWAQCNRFTYEFMNAEFVKRFLCDVCFVYSHCIY